MSDLADDLNAYGIVSVDAPYSPDEIAAINARLDPHFAGISDRPRSYAYASDMSGLGVLDIVLGERMVSSLYEVMPDPVIYHLHCYEIAALQTQSHIFGYDLHGWHRDSDSDYSSDRPSHVSLFTHLSDVGELDGPFEFIPNNADRGFSNRTPACRMSGPAGTSYYWNRHFFHRASPNRGPRRRRILKISIQSSRWPSTSLALDHLAPVAAAMSAADPRRAALFGHGASGAEGTPSGISYARVPTNIQVDIGLVPVLRKKLKDLVKGPGVKTNVAYDA